MRNLVRHLTVRLGGAAAAAALLVALGGSALPAYASTSTQHVGSCFSGSWTTIQEAVDAIPPLGSGKIMVCPGSYPEAININGKGMVVLRGKAGATVVAPTNSYNGPLLQAVGTTRLTVQKMAFDGTADTGGIPAGIALIDTPAVIKNNSFTNLPVHAVFATSSAGSGRLTATHNMITNTDRGIWVNPPAGGIFTVNITRNTLYRSAAGVGPGISLSNNTNSKVTGNKITSYAAGILITDSSKTRISGNKIYSAVVTGIGLVSDSPAAPANNNRVSGNKIEAAGTRGIAVWAIGGTASGNQVSGNTITDTASMNAADNGIEVITSGVGSTITGLRVRGNKLVNIFLPWSFSDPVSGVTGLTVRGNKCKPVAPCIPVLP